VLDRDGKIIDEANWKQWDKIWGRPHDVEISPYDPERTCGSSTPTLTSSASSHMTANSAS
jgi:hypothetical protein